MSNVKILIANSEPARVKKIGIQLIARGYEVIMTHNPERFTDIALKERPDVIIFDDPGFVENRLTGDGEMPPTGSDDMLQTVFLKRWTVDQDYHKALDESIPQHLMTSSSIDAIIVAIDAYATAIDTHDDIPLPRDTG